MQCHHCGSESSRKNGSYQGVQRYICKECGRSFTSRERRFGRCVKEQALDMHLNNVGIRKIARFVGASSTAVIKWIRSAREQLSEQLRQAGEQVACELPDVIEMDEIYTFVKKTAPGSHMDCL
ncbi:MAG: hypothetical protein FWG26_02955 [Betaproteobacteria bacterium]|nr:hypothetical protein [Betaproteobacteria bacterium]